MSNKWKCLCCERELKKAPTKLGWIQVRYGQGVCFSCIESMEAARKSILNIESSDTGPEVDEGFVADLISIFREETRYRDWDTDEQRFQAIKSRVCRAFGKAGSKVKEAAHD